jgi:putative transposase
LLPDHGHMCLEILPKHAVASVIGFLKGKRALTIARRVQEKDRNFVGNTSGRAAMWCLRWDLS